ncbi:MAG: hypothetical protein R3A11_07870 [Bdellovibrionota bacterium]
MKTMTTLLCGMLLVFSACAKSRVSDLSERVDSFNQSLRWSSLKSAAIYMSSENKQTLLDKYSELFAQSRIVEFSILDIGLNSQRKKGTVIVEFSYYDLSDNNLGYRQEIQTWEFVAAKQSWVVTDAQPLSTSNP